MAETIEPFDGGPYMEEAGWSTIWAAGMGNGVMTRGTASATANLAVYSEEDGRQIKVSSGQAHIRGHIYRSTDVIIRSLDPNTSGNPRIDRVVLRLDTSGKSATPHVIKGTPALSPSAPTMIQVPGGIWDIPLALVPIPNGFTSIDADTVVRNRMFAGETGYVPYTLGVYPLDSNGTGIGWAAPEAQSISANFARYRIRDMTCEVHVLQSVRIAAGTGYEYAMSLPVPARQDVRQTGTAITQNVHGFCMTIPNSIAISGPTPDTDYGIVSIRRYDTPFTNLTNSSTYTNDGFDLVYEIAPG